MVQLEWSGGELHASLLQRPIGAIISSGYTAVLQRVRHRRSRCPNGWFSCNNPQKSGIGGASPAAQ